MDPRAARSPRRPAISGDLLDQLRRFDPALPIERAHTPPACWYLDASFLALERDTVFSRNWIAVARAAQLGKAGDYLAGEVCGIPFFVLRHDDGSLHAFHNACRHHAAELLTGSGCLARTGRSAALTCRYHGWTYGIDGSLRSAPHMAGVEDFDPSTMGLAPIHLETWRGYVFLHLGEDPAPLAQQLAGLDARLDAFGAASLHHAETRSYLVDCNWKVFVDNYLDGGYHVSALHPGLAADLDLDTYTTELDGRLAVQSCAASGDRLGSRALYAWVHPNLMLNRYGPVLDVNRVFPVGAHRTRVVFDFFFEERALSDPAFVASCVARSEQVQQEDIGVSEAVQRGMASPSYDRGRYAPRLETAAHHFHRLLATELSGAAHPSTDGDPA